MRCPVKDKSNVYLSSWVRTASRLGTFYQQGTGQWPHVWGCCGNCSDIPTRVSQCALCARLSCSLPSTSGKSARIHCLRQCIRALFKAVTWVADLSPLQAACAALRLSPCDAAMSLLLCWLCEAWSRTDRRVRLAALRPVRDLGQRPNKRASISKRYRRSLLAYLLKTKG